MTAARASKPASWAVKKEERKYMTRTREKERGKQLEQREGYTMTDSNMDRKKNRLNCKNKIDVTYEYTIIYVKFSSGIG